MHRFVSPFSHRLVREVRISNAARSAISCRLKSVVLLASLFLGLGCSSQGTGNGSSTLPVEQTAERRVAADVSQDQLAEPAPEPRNRLTLQPLGGLTHGTGTATSAAEICSYDPASRRLFVVNVEQQAIDVLDITDVNTPRKVAALDVKELGIPTSVTCRNGLIAASVVASSKKQPGHVVFLSTEGQPLQKLTVGHTPDMLTFTPDGKWLLVANEGEPENDYSFDPEGSVSLIPVSGPVAQLNDADVMTADFHAFNDQRATLDRSVRIYGKKASVAQDLEPEYIAVSPDSKTAWIVCQENNAVAVLDLEQKRITRVAGLGFKDHSLPGNGFDASDKDDKIRIRPWPVLGMYQPDGMATFQIGDETYLITANDGKDRDYPGLNEQCRVKDLKLDPHAFPNATELQKSEHLGRLRVTNATGDLNGDGLFEELHSYGGRSFAIWNSRLEQVFESGDQLERITAAAFPEYFNSDHESQAFDDRSDNKGPEPEGAAVGTIDGRTYLFLGLERMGGVAVFDVTEPQAPVFESYVNTRDFKGQAGQKTAGDLGPEGVLFIKAEESPTGEPLLAVSYEISGTTRLFRINVATETPPVSMP